MKRVSQIFALAALMAAHGNAQSTTTVSNNPSVVTSYFSICPTVTTTTITLSTTTTICPGPGCGGTTTLLYNAQPITTVGPDGRTTVFEQAHYTAPCACNGGICDAVYTLTRPCPCTAPWAPTGVPAGFTTAVVTCKACAQNGGPSTVTVVTPVSNGPYASQTPAMGAPNNGASANAAASAYAYASAGPNGAVAGAGANAVASAGNGYAAANANAGASAYANASNGTSGASAGASADAEAGSSATPVSSNATYTPAPPSSSNPVAPYTGSAHRAVYAFSAVAAGVVGWLALAL